MADNVAITAGTGTAIHADEYTHSTLGSGKTQLVKLVDGTLDSSTAIAAGGGVEAGALRVTVASDSTGVLSIDDNGGSITVDGTVTANLSATDNAVLDAIEADTTTLTTTVYTEGATDSTITGVPSLMEISGDELKPIQGMVANGGYGLVTITPGHVSTDNSTSTPLAGNAVFTGTWEDITNHGIIVVSIKTSHASATNGLSIQFSTDGTNIDNSDTFTISADTGKTFSFQAAAKYFRIVYTNGSTLQTYFRLQTVLKPSYAKPSSHRVSDSLTLEDDAELVKAVIAGETTAGGGSFVNVKVNPSGTLETNATQSGTWNITNVSGTVSLPTGAATAVKQPALGTAGTASADVITVQGIASMTALKVDGSAVTQPVSGTVAVTNAGITTIAGAVSGTEMQVDVLTMPTTTVTATDLDIRPLVNTDVVTAELSAVDNAVLDTIAAKDFATQTTLSAMNAKMVSGTDIGDVTINNASGASAVNIQDGGNTITVDGTVAVTNADITSIKTAVETIDNAISGSEMQVDVVGALPAGTNTIGAVKSVPSDIDINGSNANHADKYYTNAGAVTDGIIWSPAAGKRWHVLNLTINVSAACTVTIEDDLAAGDNPRLKFEFAANSGITIPYNKEHPFSSGEDAADLLITTTAGNVYVQAVGYEI